jgi:hypothetical protein
MAPSPIIPATSATPAATDNRFPIVGNHPRFLLPVCFLMRFDSCLGFVLTGQMGPTGLFQLFSFSAFSFCPSAFSFSAFQLFSFSAFLFSFPTPVKYSVRLRVWG